MNRDQQINGESRSLRRAFIPPVTKSPRPPSIDETDLDSVLFWARLAAAQSRKSRERLLLETNILQAMSESESFLAEFLHWRVSEVFTAREKAAMELSEAISRQAEKKIVDPLLENARRHFKPAQMIQLTLSIQAINHWHDARSPQSESKPRRKKHTLPAPHPELAKVYKRLRKHFGKKA